MWIESIEHTLSSTECNWFFLYCCSYWYPTYFQCMRHCSFTFTSWIRNKKGQTRNKYRIENIESISLCGWNGAGVSGAFLFLSFSHESRCWMLQTFFSIISLLHTLTHTYKYIEHELCWHWIVFSSRSGLITSLSSTLFSAAIFAKQNHYVK